MIKRTKVIEDCDLLFYDGLMAWDCEKGWDELIADLCYEIEELLEHEVWADEPPFVTQIKEKFGVLRFYMSASTEEIDDLIENAENLSVQTCEICGKAGIPRIIKGWIMTRCDTCAQEEE